ncbi:probable sarcosine oxidase [Impatiens glandulifera]|uniref:probable sarcosine oxidase n=1 Tax=Impatiens glandulifera TaxID=253017 RepID=UPI001FB18DA3|nr:probable sarcosine oxidase [Impatiens glandulifera]
MENSGEKFDIIVVGAGVMGSATAYAASKRGLKVLLLEQFDLLHFRGSSHGESRTIRASYPENYYPPMVIEAAKLWEEAELEAGYNVYFKTSHLDFGPSDNPSLLHVISSCEINKIDHRILDAHQVFDEMSGRIKIPDDWIGVATELGGIIKPTKAVSMFQSLAMKHGAVIRDRIEVKGIEPIDEQEGGGILISTTCGNQFRSSKCAITAGAWMKNLVKKVTGKHLPIQPVETSVFYWRIKQGHESDFTISPGKFPTFASYGNPYIYGTPSLEFPGLIKIPIHGGLECNPDERKWKAAKEVIIEEIREWIRGRFGDLVDADGGPVITQSCLYSMTPDEDYVIDFLGGEFGKNLVVAGGFSGHGFKMSPVIGKIVVEMLLDGEVGGGVDMKYFKIERFDGGLNGNAKSFADQVCFSSS